MFLEISAAYNSAKVALEVAKAANGLSNYNELVSAISDVNSKLMQANMVALESQEKQFSLTNEISGLKEKLRQIEDWEGQMKRYKLHEFPTNGLAYALQPGMEQGEPIHYLCTTCADQKQKTILQPRGNLLYCTIHKTNIVIQAPPLLQKQNRRQSNWIRDGRF